MANPELLQRVKDEVAYDRKISDADAIAVSVDDNGTVTLRGTVGSLHQRIEAGRAAERVRGVYAVDNHLKIRIMEGESRADADLRGEVLQALMLDTALPSSIDVRVQDGWVTLGGHADWMYQRAGAELVARNVPGVLTVDNDIHVNDPPFTSEDIRHSIKHAFEHAARMDAEGLSVSSLDGTITLTGTLRSRSEHDQAVAIARNMPSVRVVHDHIMVLD